MHNRVWTKTAEGCLEVRGKILGLVGYGHIGTQLGILAEAVGMKVHCWSWIRPSLVRERDCGCACLYG